VPLLADDDVRLAGHHLHLCYPLLVLFGVLAGLPTLDIIFLAEHEQHHIGVLLDRA